MRNNEILIWSLQLLTQHSNNSRLRKKLQIIVYLINYENYKVSSVIKIQLILKKLSILHTNYNLLYFGNPVSYHCVISLFQSLTAFPTTEVDKKCLVGWKFPQNFNFIYLYTVLQMDLLFLKGSLLSYQNSTISGKCLNYTWKYLYYQLMFFIFFIICTSL